MKTGIQHVAPGEGLMDAEEQEDRTSQRGRRRAGQEESSRRSHRDIAAHAPGAITSRPTSSIIPPAAPAPPGLKATPGKTPQVQMGKPQESVTRATWGSSSCPTFAQPPSLALCSPPCFLVMLAESHTTHVSPPSPPVTRRTNRTPPRSPRYRSLQFTSFHLIM